MERFIPLSPIKRGHVKKGVIAAILNGTRSKNIIPVLQQILARLRNRVKEITLDLAGNMGLKTKKCFPNAEQVIDRFNAQQLAGEALQEIRIKHQWEAINNENQAIEACKKAKETFFPEVLCNGDSLKELLARSRCLLYKSEHKWTCEQKERALVLFERNPDIEKAYRLSQELSWIYNSTTDKIYAFTRLAGWAHKAER